MDISSRDYKILSVSAEKMGGETMKRKLGKRFRSIIGVLLTLGFFVFILLVLNSWLGEEGVRFDYRAMFIYLGSEDNEPLENLTLKWSAPQVDNSFIEETYSSWELYYVEDDNSLTLQANAAGVINLRGSRSSQLGIYSFGHENEQFGPVLNTWIDKLYPREVFLNLGYGVVDKERAGDLTLRVYGQTAPIAGWRALSQENKRIDFSFVVGLYSENILVERFEWTQENGPPASYWLWPS